MHRAIHLCRWHFWHRYRWWHVAVAIDFLVLAVLCRVSPAEPAYQVVALLLFAPLPLGLAALAGVFTLGAGGDLAARESMYPARMFTLPMRTRDLIVWPILVGAAAVVGAWVAIATLVLRPIGLAVPLWTPGLAMAASLAWLQALAWCPLGLPWLRLPMAIGLAYAILFGAAATAAVSAQTPPGEGYVFWKSMAPIVAVVLALQLPIACAVATYGVSRARRGDTPSWLSFLADRGARALGAVTMRPFRSPAAAQFWLEWRLYGRSLPYAMAWMIPVFAGVMLVHRSAPGSPFRSPLFLLLLVPLMTFGAGGELGRLAAQRGSRATASFLAVRPMREIEFVRTKLLVAAASVGMAYLLTAPVAAILVLATGSLAEHAAIWQAMADRSTPIKATAACLLVLLGLPVLAWTMLVKALFLGLGGRTWMSAIPAAALVLLMFPSVGIAWWCLEEPGRAQRLWAAAVPLAELLAAVKLVLAGLVLRALRRGAVISRQAAVRLVVLWAAAVLGLLAAILWLAPPGLIPWHFGLAIAVLAVPAVRIGLAPLAVRWNRHR